MPYVRRAQGRLNLQCTSLMLSVFALSFTLLPFSNSVLAKLTINTFTGMCPAVFLHILKYWYRHIATIMWLYNVLKLKKTYSFTVFSTFWWLFKVSCGVLQFFSHILFSVLTEFTEATRITGGLSKHKQKPYNAYYPNN